MEADLIKIEEKNHLARDLKSNAVINTSKNVYTQAKEAKQKRQSLEKRLDSVEQKMDAILNILEKKDNT